MVAAEKELLGKCITCTVYVIRRVAVNPTGLSAHALSHWHVTDFETARRTTPNRLGLSKIWPMTLQGHRTAAYYVPT